MYLRDLKLNNFKNCQSAELSLSEKINCFVGMNAAGKTNILDSIYYLAFCKSYFSLTDKQNIRHGEDFFAIHGEFHFDNDELHTISCVQKNNSKKSFKCDKKEYERLADHIGKIPLVMISPYDSDLINSGSELRRKFIDGVISQFDASYLNCLLNYNKALQQRNKQLKFFMENRIWDDTLLDMWNRQLIQNAVPINEKRRKFLEEFIPVFQKYYEIVSFVEGQRDKTMGEKVSIRYNSALNDKPFPIYGDGLNVRDWIYVDDHCRAIDMIIRNAPSGSIFNVGSGTLLSNITLVKEILSQLGKTEDLITFVADRKGHDRKYALNCDKLITELGWKPRVDFSDGLKETILWYRDKV